MYRSVLLALVISLLYLPLIAQQQPITIAQQQFIQSRAKSKVRTYTEYIELIARTKGKEVDLRDGYKQNIFLSCGKEGAKTRVFNDLIPPQVLQKSIAFEKSLQLETYINKIPEHYGENISLTYADMDVSDVYYSASDNWYFVKVTAVRSIDGIYQHASERTPHKAKDKVDFFVYANLVNGEVKMGGIYGVQPHEINDNYTKARIVKGTEGASGLALLGKPLKVKSETIRKKFKRGKEYTIAWEGGLADDIIQLELIPKDTLKTSSKQLVSMLNSNSYKFIPSSNDNIETYKLRIKNVSTGRFVQSGYFDIRRKIPLGATIAVPTIVTGVIIYLLTRPDDPPIVIEEKLIDDPGLPTR